MWVCVFGVFVCVCDSHKDDTNLLEFIYILFSWCRKLFECNTDNIWWNIETTTEMKFPTSYMKSNYAFTVNVCTWKHYVFRIKICNNVILRSCDQNSINLLHGKYCTEYGIDCISVVPSAPKWIWLRHWLSTEHCAPTTTHRITTSKKREKRPKYRKI